MEAQRDLIVEITRPLFDAAARLRALAAADEEGALVDGASPQERLVAMIDDARQRLGAARIERRDVDDILYAIIALVDEIAVSGGEALRGRWIDRPLQVHFFAESTAGDGFFARLREARGRPERRHVLVVYHLCLLFGFRGRYALRGEADLREMIAEVTDEVWPRGGDAPPPLAPAGGHDLARAAARRSIPPALVGAALLVLAIALHVGLRLHTAWSADEALREVTAVTAELAARQEAAP